MITGNIVKLKDGYVVIVTDVTDKHVRWVSASASNVSGGTPQISKEEKVDCYCDEYIGCGKQIII